MRALPPSLVKAAESALPGPIMRWARVRKFDRGRSRYPRRVVERSYAGVRHRVEIASDYGERYDADCAELPEVAWLRQGRLRPGARVFDVGASYGVVALMLGDVVGPSGKVVALEAHPEDAANLARTKELNDMDQLVCVHAAGAAEPGEIVFGRNGEVDDGRRRWGDLRVPAVTIDDLARRYGEPDVVFIDVEGYEDRVLRGAADTIRRGPDWFVEVHGDAQLAKYGASNAEVIARLGDAGYSLFAGGGGPIRPLAEAPPALLRGRFYLLARRS